uniref:Ig-like domain-containing protein n=1 Tax=Cyprinus carpio carpio TaxID=630221 RepID=A0A8C1BE79_CYPCA
MFDISSGNLSLLISNLTEEDEGLYSCWSNENQHKNFSLTVKGCTLSETEREPETKYTGDSVLLSCSCEDPNSKPEDFRWTHVESSGTEVSSETPRYKDRVHTFHKTTPSNLSLLISNLTEDDQGTYRCTVNHKTSADTRLIVKGCSLSGNEGSVEISRYSGESVFLSCSVKCSPRHEPDSKFRWKLPNYIEINHTINPTELRRLYQGRLHMFDISSGNLSLLISDLTEEDEGLYSCWSDENQHKNFRLTVKGCTLSETEREPETKYTGDSVLLSCSCEDPNTKPEDFRWTHVESSGTEVSSETPRYKDR